MNPVPMNDVVVELLVRMMCGEASEPPLVGLVEIEDERYRVWAHGTRRRIETESGRLRSIGSEDEVLAWVGASELPLALGRRSFGFADGEAPWNRLRRLAFVDLDLQERRPAGPVVAGERFGRATAEVVLDHQYHEDFALRLVLDVATGMPFEVEEAGETVLRWIEFEVVDGVEEFLLRWDGEVLRGGWYALPPDGDGGPEDDEEDVFDDSSESLMGGIEWSYPMILRRPETDEPWPEDIIGPQPVVAEWSDGSHQWRVHLHDDPALSAESTAAVVDVLRTLGRGRGGEDVARAD